MSTASRAICMMGLHLSVEHHSSQGFSIVTLSAHHLSHSRWCEKSVIYLPVQWLSISIPDSKGTSRYDQLHTQWHATKHWRHDIPEYSTADTLLAHPVSRTSANLSRRPGQLRRRTPRHRPAHAEPFHPLCQRYANSFVRHIDVR